jgi:hypothetical protein
VQLLAVAVLAIAGALVAPGTVAAVGAPRTLHYRVAGEPWDLGMSAQCPDGSLRYGIETRAGKPIGTATLCVLRTSKVDERGGGVTITERIRETDAFRDGWLATAQTQTYRVPADGKRSNVTLSGVVTGGTGRYARARGTITGTGVNTPKRLNVAVTVRLR